MSLLLVGIHGGRGEAIVQRLISQGDEVRVIEADEDASEKWRSLGALVARPDSDMPDLVERAAQNARTVVIGDAAAKRRELVHAILEGARRAGVERVILYAARPSGSAVEAVTASRLQYVVLATGRKGLLFGSGGIGAADLAEAIDAADDLSDQPHLELDLADVESWAALGCDDRSGGATNPSFSHRRPNNE